MLNDQDAEYLERIVQNQEEQIRLLRKIRSELGWIDFFLFIIVAIILFQFGG